MKKLWSPAHHERVLHSDDAAVQDGGGNWWDLQHLATPGLSFARRQRLSPQVGHQLLDFLHLPFGIEGLGLVDGCLWHDHAGRAVLDLCKDLDWLSYRVVEGGGEVKWRSFEFIKRDQLLWSISDIPQSLILKFTYLVNRWLTKGYRILC